MKIVLMRDNNSFKIIYGSDIEKVSYIKSGQQVWCQLTKSRNLKHHKKFFAIVNCAFESQSKFENVDNFLSALKFEIGHYEIGRNFKGDKIPLLKSISFAKMDQLEFEKFYCSALQILSKFIGCTVEELENNSGDYI